jgi:hypothetical protein
VTEGEEGAGVDAQRLEDMLSKVLIERGSRDLLDYLTDTIHSWAIHPRCARFVRQRDVESGFYTAGRVLRLAPLVVFETAIDDWVRSASSVCQKTF